MSSAAADAIRRFNNRISRGTGIIEMHEKAEAKEGKLKFGQGYFATRWFRIKSIKVLIMYFLGTLIQGKRGKEEGEEEQEEEKGKT